jgi:hypothetical protein
MSPYRRAWIAWAILTIGGLAVIERLALASGDMDNTFPRTFGLCSDSTQASPGASLPASPSWAAWFGSAGTF